MGAMGGGLVGTGPVIAVPDSLGEASVVEASIVGVCVVPAGLCEPLPWEALFCESPFCKPLAGGSTDV
jgi:hypothetical protein